MLIAHTLQLFQHLSQVVYRSRHVDHPIFSGVLVLSLLVLSRPVVRDEANHHSADHQGGDAEAQDPTQGSGSGKGSITVSSAENPRSVAFLHGPPRPP